MKTDIITVLLKHKIYEFCIDVCFRSISRNFKFSSNIRIPSVGETFEMIYDKENDDIYYRCKVIDHKTMDCYKEFTIDEKESMAFAISYKANECGGEIINEDEETYFMHDELVNLEFSYINQKR